MPGAGWTPFDRANASMGGGNLTLVAVVRDIAQAIPVSGSYLGNAEASEEMPVEVQVAAN